MVQSKLKITQLGCVCGGGGYPVKEADYRLTYGVDVNELIRMVIRPRTGAVPPSVSCSAIQLHLHFSVSFLYKPTEKY